MNANSQIKGLLTAVVAVGWSVCAAIAQDAPPAGGAAAAPVITTAVEAVPAVTAAKTPEAPKLSADNKVSIQLDNVPVQDVVRMFTRISGANIIAGNLPATNVTASLQEVEWEAALREILGSVGLTLAQRNAGIYAVVSKADTMVEPSTSDIVFLNYTTPSNVLPVVNSLMTGISNTSASAFNGANAIIIRGPLSQVSAIKQVVGRLDKQREQVLIECKFVELNDQAIKDLGINWKVLEGWTAGLRTPKYTIGKTKTDNDSLQETTIERNTTLDAALGFDTTTSGTDGSTHNRNNTRATGYNVTDAQIGGDTGNTATLVPSRDYTKTKDKLNKTESVNALTAVLSADDFALTLSALQQNDGVEVVSNPKIVVASGETATIHVGRSEPNVIALPQGDTGDRYAYALDSQQPYIETGVKLHVLPTINTSNSITIKIQPELSEKLADKVIGTTGISYPVIKTRKIDTEFNLESGRTVAIGGLTTSSDIENIKKVPVLGDIPVIGTYLFRYTHKEKIQDEVIIFVTVNVAMPETLVQVSGIPEDGKLIHQHLARKAQDAAKAEESARVKTLKKTP